MTHPVRECVSCEKPKQHYARNLCSKCYRLAASAGTITEYPPMQTVSLDVDYVIVGRATAWLAAHNALLPGERRAHLPTRPPLTQGERIEVLRVARHSVPRWVAIPALGISGRKAPHYLAAAGHFSDPHASRKVAA